MDASSVNTQTSASRCRTFCFERWRELLAPSTFIGRRALTLNVRTATEEAIELAKSSLRSGGLTKKAADPNQAGHGIAMLPDVAREALHFLSQDFVLKRKQPSVIDLLRQNLEALTHQDAEIKESELARLDALAKQLKQTYIDDALDCIENILSCEPKKLSELESVCETLISDLRARGWTDQTISEFIHHAETTPGTVPELIKYLKTQLNTAPKDFKCFIAVTIERIERDLPSDDSFLLHRDEIEIPRGPKGPFIKTNVSALDHRFAAELALNKVSSVLGAASVFVAATVQVRSPVVIVEYETTIAAVDTRELLPKEHRSPSPGQVARIIRSARDAFSAPSGDPVFEAIRHRERALRAGDLESTFMLLWLGLERLIVGTYEYGKILDAAKSLVPKSIALGKLRRDVAALAAAIDYANLSVSQRGDLYNLVGRKEKNQTDRNRLLEFLLADESQSRKLTGVFYDSSPWLVQWYFNLRKRLGDGTPDKLGTHLSDYFEASRSRIERQMLRLYRARNNVAHAARGPTWIADLVRHAHYYLTQIIAIVVHYREQAPTRPSAEILMERAGQYDAYLALLQANHRHALRTETLLKPTTLLGGSRDPTAL